MNYFFLASAMCFICLIAAVQAYSIFPQPIAFTATDTHNTLYYPASYLITGQIFAAAIPQVGTTIQVAPGMNIFSPGGLQMTDDVGNVINIQDYCQGPQTLVKFADASTIFFNSPILGPAPVVGVAALISCPMQTVCTTTTGVGAYCGLAEDAGFPKTLGASFGAESELIHVGDVDNDTSPDVIVGTKRGLGIALEPTIFVAPSISTTTLGLNNTPQNTPITLNTSVVLNDFSPASIFPSALEVVGSTSNPSSTFSPGSVEGYYNSGVSSGNPIYSALPGFPFNPGTFPNSFYVSPPSSDDIDGDGTKEIVFAKSEPTSTVAGLPNGWVTALNVVTPTSTGLQSLPNFPILVGQNGFGFSFSEMYPPAIFTDPTNQAHRIIAFASQGSSAMNTMTPTIWLVNSQGQILPNWPQTLVGNKSSNIVVGNIDGTSDPEIIVLTTDQLTSVYPTQYTLYAFHLDGSAVQNFPVTLTPPANNGGYPFAGTPELSLAYFVYNSPYAQIIVGGNGFVVNGNGSTWPQFPIQGVPTTRYSLVSDVSGDWFPDLIFSTRVCNPVYCLPYLIAADTNGNLIPGIRLSTISDGSHPFTLGDIGPMGADGQVDIITFDYGLIHAYATSGNIGTAFWPTPFGNSQNTGYLP